MGGRYRHAISRNVSAHVGYNRDRGVRPATDTQAEEVYFQHNIDIGVDFGFARALTLTRRLTFSFDTGTVFLRDSFSSRFDVVGSAALNYRMGRSWMADLTYYRGVNYAALLSAPTFSDSLTASTGGNLGPRLSLSARAGLATGRLGFSRDGSGYSAAQAGADLSVAVVGPVSASAGYTYYRYSFDDSSLLLTGVATEMRRHTVFVGGSVSLSFLGTRTRGGYAAR